MDYLQFVNLLCKHIQKRSNRPPFYVVSFLDSVKWESPLFKSKGGSIDKTLFTSSWLGGVTRPSVFGEYRYLLVEEILTNKFLKGHKNSPIYGI